MRLLCLSIMAFVLSGCFSLQNGSLQTGIDLYKPEELRKLHVEIKTNNQDLEFSYSNHSNSGLHYSKKFNQLISIGDFSGEISVPKGQKLFISAGNYDQARLHVSGFASVEPTQNSIKLNFVAEDALTKLRDVINSLTEDQKSDLRVIVGLYQEAINSPRYLIDSLRSKAEAQLSVFYRETGTRDTFLQSYLSSMDFNIQLATMFNAGGGFSFDDMEKEKIRESKRMLTTVSLIIDTY